MFLRRIWPQFDPQSMSSRARSFLVVAAVHFTAIGGSILFRPDLYQAPAFIPLADPSRLWLWGGSYMVTGVVCTVAALTAWPSFARAGLSLGFVVLIVSAAAIGVGVVESWLNPALVDSSPMVPLTLAALAVKDLLMVSQPLRTPTEDQSNARYRQDHAA